MTPAAAPGTVRANQFGPPLAVGIPAYCRVEGVIDQRTGLDGKPYAITFALALPDAWNRNRPFQASGRASAKVIA